MLHKTRIISLLFVAAMASACWPGGSLLSFDAPSNDAASAEEDRRSAGAEDTTATATRAAKRDAQVAPYAPPSTPEAETVRPARSLHHAPAKRRSPAKRSKAQRKPDGCARGTFFDPRGECWSCPKGYHRTVFPVTANNACEKRLEIKHRKVAGKMNATGVFKTDCKRGWFLHQLSGVCYKCPTGFNRTVFGIGSNQACERWEGPVWKPAKLHKKLTCGNNGNRACTVLERLPSCDPGLKENAKAVCVPLLPGESPFLAGLGEKSKAIAELGTEACHALLRPIPASQLPPELAGLQNECRQRAMVGFVCEMPSMIDQVSALTDYAQSFSKAWDSKPCSDWSVVARPLCAATMATLGDAPEVLRCLGAAIEAGALGELDRGAVCEAGGQIAFSIAVTRKIKLKGKPKKKESRLDQLKRMLINSGKVVKGAADVSAQLDRLAECRILD